MYRITYEEFLNTHDLDLSGLVHRKLSVSLNGNKIPVDSVGEIIGSRTSNKFGAGGYIEFFVPQFDNLYSKDIALVLGYGRPRPLNETIGSQANRIGSADVAKVTYRDTLELSEPQWYNYASPVADDPWQYFPVSAFYEYYNDSSDVTGPAYSIELPDLSGSTADLSAEIYGITDIPGEGNDHHVFLNFNGIEVADGQFEGSNTFELSESGLIVKPSNNQFQIGLRSIEGMPFDRVALNKLSVEYDRFAIAQDGLVEGKFGGGEVFEVSGFDSNNIQVYTIDDNGRPKVLTRTDTSTEGTVMFKTGADGGRYIAVGQNAYKTPKENNVIGLPALDNIRSGEAEYLIITHSDFIGPALEEFVALRSTKYSVKVVDVQQIFHQFSDLHVPSSSAISDYIRFAEKNLNTEFVLLVGGDTYDYKQHVSSSKSFVPTQYTTTTADNLKITQTPSDAKYGDLDDDGVPDIPIGRFPVRTTTELANIVEKIRDYEAREGYAGRILMAADQADNGNGVSFTGDAISLIETIPGDWAGALRTDYRAFPDYEDASSARNKIFAAINAGVSVTAYMGHSSRVGWSNSSPKLLQRNDIAAFTNIDKPTVVTQWGCWNTYFVDPRGNSMAETFMNNGLNGAATVLGASTLTKAASEFLLAMELNKFLYNEGEPIGTAVIKAKHSLARIEPSASDVLLGWQILGDPALVINH